MSKHFKWTHLLEAIKHNDITAVEDALFILDEKIWHTHLDSEQTSLEIAASLGRDKIVELLLHHPSIETISYAFKESRIWFAHTVASINNHVRCVQLLLACDDVFDTLLETSVVCSSRQIQHEVEVLRLQRVLQVKGNSPGNVKRYAGLVRKSVERSIKFGYIREILDDQKLPEKFRTDCLAFIAEKYSPLHTAVLFQNHATIEDLINETKSWHNIENESSTILELAAETKNLKILHYLVTKAQENGKNALPYLEKACDKKYISIEVLNYCFTNRWIETKFNDTWKRRMQSAVDSVKEPIATFILEKFYLPSKFSGAKYTHFLGLETGRMRDVTIRSKHSSARRRSSTTLKYDIRASLLKTAASTKQRKTVQAMMRCIETQKSIDYANQVASEMFALCVKYGLCEMADYFEENFEVAELTGENCWCKLIDQPCMVMVERMGRECSCSGRIPISLTYTMRLTDYLLQDSHFTSEWQLIRSIEPIPTRFDRDQITAKLAQSMDYVDLNAFTDLTIKSLLPKDDFYHLCTFFQKSSVSERRVLSMFMDGLLVSVLNLGEKCQEIFHRCVNRSGVRILDRRLVRNSPDLSSVDGYDDMLKLSRGASFKYRSLKSDCRVAIRMAVRGASPRVCSLTDQILSLALDGTLPRTMVDYLLFRNERLPKDLTVP